MHLPSATTFIVILFILSKFKSKINSLTAKKQHNGYINRYAVLLFSTCLYLIQSPYLPISYTLITLSASLSSFAVWFVTDFTT
jgi:hypothetical protein